VRISRGLREDGVRTAFIARTALSTGFTRRNAAGMKWDRRVPEAWVEFAVRDVVFVLLTFALLGLLTLCVKGAERL
jgi:hypothetical protein